MFLLVLSSLNGFSQKYQPEIRVTAYTNLAGGINIPQSKIWWEYEYAVPIGFPFSISGIAVDSIDVSDVGAIRFRQNVSGNSSIYLFWGFGAALSERNRDTNQSRISYLLQGNIGDRVLKIEFYQCGFINDGVTADSVNFQIWLNEKDNSLEVHIGPSSSSNPEEQFINSKGPAIGLMNGDENDVTTFALMLTGDVKSPNPVNSSNIYNLPCLNSLPPSGYVYRFVPVH